MESTRIILAAGVPRSGSTWLFNAVRRVLEEAGEECHAAWVSSWDRKHPAPTHLVKVHNPADVDFRADIIVTTYRPTAECLASLVRMGWLAPDPAVIRTRWENHEDLYAHWKKRSTLEIHYEEIMNRPRNALARLAGVLCIELNDTCLDRVAAELRRLKAPDEGGYDPKTLLHPRHRSEDGSDGPSPEDIVAMMKS